MIVSKDILIDSQVLSNSFYEKYGDLELLKGIDESVDPKMEFYYYLLASPTTFGTYYCSHSVKHVENNLLEGLSTKNCKIRLKVDGELSQVIWQYDVSSEALNRSLFVTMKNGVKLYPVFVTCPVFEEFYDLGRYHEFVAFRDENVRITEIRFYIVMEYDPAGTTPRFILVENEEKGTSNTRKTGDNPEDKLAQKKPQPKIVDTKGSSIDSDVVELLDGVTDDFLNPIFIACVPLMQKKYESQLVVNSVLELFKSLTPNLIELSPVCFTRIQEQSMVDLLKSIRKALDGEFGMNQAVTGLPIINNMSTQFCTADDETPMIIQQQTALTEKVFDSCLQYRCEVEIFPDAPNELYSMICLNKEGLFAYVNGPKEHEENLRVEKIGNRL
uniref:Uncharacterized protein n=1 Tax=Acrobeloides nanus TaxID=290746 RepID=A0A914E666_9BILA